MTDNFSKAVPTLEFDKIRAELASLCQTEGAKEMALRIMPERDPWSVGLRQRQTSDAKLLITAKGQPPFSSVTDVTEPIDRAVRGGVLTPRELLSISGLLTASRRVYDYFFGDGDDRSGNSLTEHFGRIIPIRRLEDEISSAILSEDMISDDASPGLSDIRRKMRRLNAGIRETLQRYASAGGQFAKYLQENIVTMRNGRYVVPVKSEYKNEVKGLVHDTSASGATFFIEPLAVVDANNELRTLEVSEEREIERILSQLSASVAASADEIKGDYDALTFLAFVFARGELSCRMNGSEPVFTGEKKLVFKNARHPLIDRNRVVPVTVALGGDYDTMIITGPNTGGKTVVLKTTGLLTLMAQAGLHIPADEGSVACVFDNVLADIGDEQSIEQSLSTFSAHMVNTVGIINSVTENSLALFDELGAGTDPTEGAALAAAIIERIRESGALCAATTHYAEIKAYALETPGVVNASCEFDVETLRPTYRLIIGAPGKSNAFAISEKLGLDKSVIDNAKKKLAVDALRFEDVLERLEESRRAAEKERRAAAEEHEKASRLLADAERISAEKLGRAENELEKSREKASQIISSARATEEYVLDSLDRIRKEQEKETFGKSIDDGRRELRRKLREAADTVDPVTEDERGTPLDKPPVRGDRVYISDLKKEGVVTSLPDKKGDLSVRIGSMITRTNLKKLRVVESAVTVKRERDVRAADSFVSSVPDDIRPSIDVRGKTAEEAWHDIDGYLDRAILANLERVTIIHGKGSGILRSAISARLAKDPRSVSFRAGIYGEGDNGVTVVELKGK